MNKKVNNFVSKPATEQAGRPVRELASEPDGAYFETKSSSTFLSLKTPLVCLIRIKLHNAFPSLIALQSVPGGRYAFR